MEIFTTDNTSAKEIKNQMLNLFIKFVEQDYQAYSDRYSEPEYIVLLNDNQAVLFNNSESLMRIDTADNLGLYIDDKIVKFTIEADDADIDEYTIGFLTSTKTKKFSLDLSDDVYNIEDEDLIEELKNTVTPRKCKAKTQDEFLDLL